MRKADVLTGESRYPALPWIAMAVFLLCFSYCIPRTCDDWMYYATDKSVGLIEQALETARTCGNGRWIGNFLAGITANSKVFRVVYWFMTMAALLWLMSQLATDGKSKRPLWCAVALLLLFVSPKAWFSGNIAWLPAFNNYIVPLVLAFLYLFRMRGLFSGTSVRDTAAGCALCLLLGFTGQLFNEAMTVYNILMAFAVALWYVLQNRRISWQSLLYLAGVAAGTAVMLLSPIYGIITTNPNADTYQKVATGIPQMIRMAVQNYRYISTYAVGANTVLLFCISVLCIALVATDDKAVNRPRGLASALIAVLVAAPLYFYFTTQDVAELLPFETLFGGKALAILLDASLYAAYVLAVLAVLWLYVGDRFVKNFGSFSLLSALACAAPLLFAQPLAHRILAAGYVFLCLFVLLLFRYVLLRFPQLMGVTIRIVCTLTAAVCVVYLLMFAPNPRVERQKIAFIEYSMAMGDREIYTPDFLYEERLWLPESELWGCFYYEEQRDIAFEHIPYDMWMERYYSYTGLD